MAFCIHNASTADFCSLICCVYIIYISIYILHIYRTHVLLYNLQKNDYGGQLISRIKIVLNFFH